MQSEHEVDYSVGKTVSEIGRYFEKRGFTIVKGNACSFHGTRHRLNKGRKCMHCVYSRHEHLRRQAHALGKIWIGDQDHFQPGDLERYQAWQNNPESGGFEAVFYDVKD